MHVEAAGSLSSWDRCLFTNSTSVSADGQILILTHASLHILTPGIGLALRPDRTALTGFPGNKTAEVWTADKGAERFQAGECPGLPLFKNVVEIDARLVQWEDWTNDARMAVSGGLDNGFRMACWSPSGLSDLGGCILAVLNLNREVSIWLPGSNSIKSSWSKAFDITEHILESIAASNSELVSIKMDKIQPEQRETKESLVMQAQSTAIGWSPAAPAHAVKDESLLAIGHKSGDVTFWRWHEGSQTMVGKGHARVLEAWPLLFEWSQWETRVNPETMNIEYSIQLAVSASFGPVKILRVSLLPDDAISIVEEFGVMPSPKAVIMMKWLPGGMLAMGRLGEISIWRSDASVTIPIPYEKYKGFTSVPTPINFLYIATQDRLMVIMKDGTLRLIDNASTAPLLHTLYNERKDGALAMSDGFYEAFVSVEKSGWIAKTPPVPRHPTMSMFGFAPLNETGSVVCAYEMISSDVKIFRAAVQHKSSFIIGRFPGEESETQIVTDVHRLLTQPKPPIMESSSRALMPILLEQRHLIYNADVAEKVLQELVNCVDLKRDMPETMFSVDDYAAYLLSDPPLQSARLALLLSQHWATNVTAGTLRPRFELQSAAIARYINSRVLSASIRVLEVRKLVETGLYRKLLSVKNALDNKVQKSDSMMEETSDADDTFTAINVNESCAACHEPIPLARLSKATCLNAHQWLRCSVTLAVLSTAAARTCTVCSRKSQVPVPLTSESGDEDRATQQLLAIARCCLYCGGRWSKGL